MLTGRSKNAGRWLTSCPASFGRGFASFDRGFAAGGRDALWRGWGLRECSALAAGAVSAGFGGPSAHAMLRPISFSIAATALWSFPGATIVIAVPLLPARPVRPIR